MKSSIKNTFERWDKIKEALEESEILEGDKYPEMLQVVALLTLASVLEDILRTIRT